jgi:putative ABC transport system ATP-binding protein
VTATAAPNRTGAAVSVAELTKTFSAGGARVTAVDDLTLDVAPGSMTAITGPSGSGKSTLLHLVGAIERADAGTVTVDGTELTALRRKGLTAYRRTVGFVFQRYHLLPALTALDNVVVPVLPHRVRYDKVVRARELLAAVGLAGRERSLPAQLSGGQQQRVAIARALMGRPRLLLADEPTGNLDSRTGVEILDLLVELRDEHGMTILVATHEQHVAARCDRLVRLRDGRVVGDVDLTTGQSPEDTLGRVSGLRL